MAPAVAIRRARPADLPGAADLLGRSLGFAAADAIPAWLMRTTDDCGGLTLVAVTDATVVGASYAFAGWADGAAFLFSCGLAVAPEHRGRHLGLQLKVAQRQEAIALGYSTIRWTTDPVNGRALRLYLSGLGARVTGYRPGLHDGLRADPGHPQDDLDIVWDLVEDRRLDRADVRDVELPWSSPGPADRDRVREAMSTLLAAGYVGSAVRLDRSARRCCVSFARAVG
ncbi:MAG TPA: GNAT family N-acetyltransferase [Solirubrobacteraceae bacterium]|nr:GNAT family N-acetyltransferase [Solirubrobacteraceae bacterium]